MKDITKKYTNGQLTIVWQPSKCIHSAICWRNEDSLPQVFNPKQKPWIMPEGADTERIISQIKKCPSGALSYYMNEKTETENATVNLENIVEVMPNGPLLVYGNLHVKTASGSELKTNKVTAFCRCGASSNKPYCDGTHKKIDFKDSNP